MRVVPVECVCVCVCVECVCGVCVHVCVCVCVSVCGVCVWSVWSMWSVCVECVCGGVVAAHPTMTATIGCPGYTDVLIKNPATHNVVKNHTLKNQTLLIDFG